MMQQHRHPRNGCLLLFGSSRVASGSSLLWVADVTNVPINAWIRAMRARYPAIALAFRGAPDPESAARTEYDELHYANFFVEADGSPMP